MTSHGRRSDRSDGVAAIETHISQLFFTTERVFKLLKPVEFAFLDLSDRSARIAAADRELQLNRRFSPDVYLGTADVHEHGELSDRMIVMRRLPAERRLSALVAEPGFEEHLRAVARVVARVHAAADPVRPAPMAGVERVKRNWDDNFDTIERFVGTVIPADDHREARDLAHRYLSTCGPLLDRRVADGYVRDGHGDLTADDIYCLDDGPRLLDCLAFDDDLRIGDVLADIGFLVMDVHRIAGAEASVVLMDAYREFGNERHPSSLAHHYVAYRAHVRAKVACLSSSRDDPGGQELASTYHRLALEHLRRSQLRIVLVGGGAGVGKSTLAAALAEHFGYVHLATDELRRLLDGVAEGQRRIVDPGTGPYQPAAVDAVYAEQLDKAELLIRAGHGVVLDASWVKESHRAAARELAARSAVEVVELECELDAAIARERIARRLSNPWNVSDATPDIVDYLHARRNPWPEAAKISTEPPEGEVLAQALSAIERADLRSSG